MTCSLITKGVNCSFFLLLKENKTEQVDKSAPAESRRTSLTSCLDGLSQQAVEVHRSAEPILMTQGREKGPARLKTQIQTVKTQAELLTVCGLNQSLLLELGDTV